MIVHVTEYVCFRTLRARITQEDIIIIMQYCALMNYILIIAMCLNYCNSIMTLGNCCLETGTCHASYVRF